MPPKKGAEYEELISKLLYAVSRKKATETWAKPKSEAALGLVATVNSDLTVAILEYRQTADKPRRLSPRSLASIILSEKTDGDSDLDDLIQALKGKGFKATLSLPGFVEKLSSELVEEKKASKPPPTAQAPKVLVPKIARTGDAFDFPTDVTSEDDRIIWAYKQSELPDRLSLLFFLREKPGGRQELVAADPGWNGFKDGQTGKTLPLILTPERIRYYDPGKDKCDTADYRPAEVKTGKNKVAGGSDPVELINGILGCGWSQIKVNGQSVTIAGGRVTAGGYRVQVRNGDNFDELPQPPLIDSFGYADLALTYNDQPCSLDDRWHFTAFGFVVADPARYLEAAKAVPPLARWSDGGEDEDTGEQYMYADLPALTGVVWTDGEEYDIPLHVSVQTSSFNDKLKVYIKRGDVPKPGYFKDMGFHVTVAYYTREDPHGYDRRNARAFRNTTGWTTRDRDVKNALADAGYTFKQVLKMGQDFLDQNI